MNAHLREFRLSSSNDHSSSICGQTAHQSVVNNDILQVCCRMVLVMLNVVMTRLNAGDTHALDQLRETPRIALDCAPITHVLAAKLEKGKCMPDAALMRGLEARLSAETATSHTAHSAAASEAAISRSLGGVSITAWCAMTWCQSVHTIHKVGESGSAGHRGSKEQFG